MELRTENDGQWYDAIAALHFQLARGEAEAIKRLEAADVPRGDRDRLQVYLAGLHARQGDDDALRALVAGHEELDHAQRNALATVLAELGWPEALAVTEVLHLEAPRDAWLSYRMAQILERNDDPAYASYRDEALAAMPGNWLIRSLGDSTSRRPARRHRDDQLLAHTIQHPYHAASLVRTATFEPNVVTLDAKALPPLYVRTSGAIDSVTARVPDPDGRGETRHELHDDGLDGDRAAGDGVYTLAGLAADLNEYPESRAGYVRVPSQRFVGSSKSIAVPADIVQEDGTRTLARAELGIVHEAGLSLRSTVDEGVYATSHVVSMADDGVASTRRWSST